MMYKLINSVSVSRQPNNNIKINIEKLESNKISLYWTTESNPNTTNRHLITENVQSEMLLKDPLALKERIYFILDDDSGQTPYLFGEQTLPIQGMTNLRDCGGYIGKGGKRLKWGMLYRSNHLHSINNDSINYMRKLGIKTIVDLRSFNEIIKSPNKYIGEIITLHVDPSAHTAELAAQFAATPDNENKDLIKYVTSQIESSKINGSGEQVFEQYRNFVTGEKAKKSFSKMLCLLLNPENSPCLLHCRGGKDRTGYAILLIMVILGISEEDIIADYMVTYQNRLERNEYKMAQYRELTNDENVLGYLLSLIDTRIEFISEAFKAMKSISGSAENYIRQELGFTENDFIAMRKIFLS